MSTKSSRVLTGSSVVSVGTATPLTGEGGNRMVHVVERKELSVTEEFSRSTLGDQPVDCDFLCTGEEAG